MDKIFFVLWFCFIGSTTEVKAQESPFLPLSEVSAKPKVSEVPKEPDKKLFRTSLNPFALTLGYYQMSFDLRILESSSFGVTAGFLTRTIASQPIKMRKYGAKYDYYFTGEVLRRGWVVGAEMGRIALNLDLAKVSAIYLDLMGRYLWSWSIVSFDVGLGLTYLTLGAAVQAPKQKTYTIPRRFSGIVPQVAFNVGLSF